MRLNDFSVCVCVCVCVYWISVSVIVLRVLSPVPPIVSASVQLRLSTPSAFRYLNQSSVVSVSEWKESERFPMTQQALSILGIEEGEQLRIFELMAAVLFLGELDFRDQEGTMDECRVVNMDQLAFVAELLGMDQNTFEVALIQKSLHTVDGVRLPVCAELSKSIQLSVHLSPPSLRPPTNLSNSHSVLSHMNSISPLAHPPSRMLTCIRARALSLSCPLPAYGSCPPSSLLSLSLSTPLSSLSLSTRIHFVVPLCVDPLTLLRMRVWKLQTRHRSCKLHWTQSTRRRTVTAWPSASTRWCSRTWFIGSTWCLIPGGVTTSLRFWTYLALRILTL
jgi:Myosin head (motor domain)